MESVSECTSKRKTILKVKVKLNVKLKLKYCCYRASAWLVRQRRLVRPTARGALFLPGWNKKSLFSLFHLWNGVRSTENMELFSSSVEKSLKFIFVETPHCSRCDAITCPPEKLSHAVRVYNNASFKVKLTW